MKNILTIILLIVFQLISFAQEKYVTSGKSVVKHISFEKNSSDNYIKATPNFRISDFLFVDENNDQTIEAEERSFIRFSLLNVGNGIAKEVKLNVSLQNPSVTGLEFERKKELGDIYSMREKQVSIAVTGRPDLVSGFAQFRIDIQEIDETNPHPLELEIPTKKFSQPNVIVASSGFYTDNAVQIEPGEPITLKTLIQNVGKGTASQVQVEFLLPAGCSPVRFNTIFHVGQLNPGDFVEIEFPFKVNRDFHLNQVQIDVIIKEKYALYGEQKTVELDLLQIPPVREEIQLKPLEFIPEDSTNIQLEDFPSIDRDIPKSMVKFSNRLALIIGNQDYEFISPPEGHNRYPVRDALVIKEYLVKVLGLREDNIFLLTNATFETISNHFELLSRLATRVGDAEVFIYFSGLGSIDSYTHTLSLLPINARREAMTPNHNMNEFFTLLGQTRAKSINFFIDATLMSSTGISSAEKTMITEKINETLPENMILYCSNEPGQTALSHPEGNHGLFTYYLLKNLKETKGEISYAGLGDFISRNVSVESLKNYSTEQDPLIYTGKQAFTWWRNTKYIDY